jgi:hypothetical protein
MLISTQDRCTVCAKRTIGSKFSLDAPDCVNLGKIGAWFALNIPWAWKLFWAYPMELLGNVGQMEACFSPFGDCVNSTQDRCIVCAKHTIGSEISLDAPDCTPT